MILLLESSTHERYEKGSSAACVLRLFILDDKVAEFHVALIFLLRARKRRFIDLRIAISRDLIDDLAFDANRLNDLCPIWPRLNLRIEEHFIQTINYGVIGYDNVQRIRSSPAWEGILRIA